MTEVQQFEDERWKKMDQPLVYRHKATLKLLGDTPISVLDVGCGDGLMLSLIKKKTPDALCEGVDFSDEGIEKAQKKNPKCTFKTADITEKLQYEANHFESVIALDVLEHLYKPEKLLTEMARVSNKYVIVVVPNFSSFPARLQVLRGRVPENNTPKKGHVYWFNYHVLSAMAKRVGLQEDGVFMNYPMERRLVIGSVVKKVGPLLPNFFALGYVARYRVSSF